MTAAIKAVGESMVASVTSLATRSHQTVGDRRKVREGGVLIVLGGLRYVAIVSRFKKHQLTGDSNAGRQYDVQSRFAVMSERYADFCPICVLLSALVSGWLSCVTNT